MVLGLGSDIIEVQRIESSIARHGQRFLDRIFTKNEQQYCLQHRDSARHFAGRFAVKESIVKAFGLGIGETISWLDIEINNDPKGKPYPSFSPRVQSHFDHPVVHITISHCKEYAMAVAIWE